MKILTYVGLHFKLSFRRDSSADKKGNILSFITTVLTLGVVLLIAKYLFDIIHTHISADISAQQFSTLLFTIIEVMLVVMGVSLEIKFFLKPSDLNITARFPMSTVSVFVAQLIVVYIYMLGVALLSTVPTMLVFGWSWGALSAGFVARLALAVVFAPLVPFAVATVLVVPTLYILTLLENHNIIKLIIFILLLTVAFVAYNYILNFLAEYYIHNTLNVDTKVYVTRFIVALNTKWNAVMWLNNIFYCTSLVKSIALLVALTVVIGGIGLLIARPVYTRVRRNVLEGNVGIFSKKSALTSDKPTMAIFKKECKDIIRTQTYAYFYLGISIITPVMVFLTSKLVKKVGQAQMGGDIAFGVSILVVFVFMILINSFSASAVSREGKQFYITKIIPVDYRVQLLAKGVLNLFVALGALLISVIILCSMRFVTITQGAIILALSLAFAVGVILNGLNLNVRHPYVKAGANADNQTNSTILIVIGLVICALEGVIAIVFPFFFTQTYLYLTLGVITAVYMAVNVLIFALTAHKKYAKIE